MEKIVYKENIGKAYLGAIVLPVCGVIILVLALMFGGWLFWGLAIASLLCGIGLIIMLALGLVGDTITADEKGVTIPLEPQQETFISWGEISEITPDTTMVGVVKIIKFTLHNPEAFATSSGLEEKLKNNEEAYGCPVVIVAQNYKRSHEEIVAVLRQKLKEAKN